MYCTMRLHASAFHSIKRFHNWMDIDLSSTSTSTLNAPFSPSLYYNLVFAYYIRMSLNCCCFSIKTAFITI